MGQEEGKPVVNASEPARNPREVSIAIFWLSPNARFIVENATHMDDEKKAMVYEFAWD